MPKKVEEKLKRQADKLARSGKLKRHPGESVKEAKDRYVYGSKVMKDYRKHKKH